MSKEGAPSATIDQINDFLEERGVTNPVSSIFAGKNGHEVVIRWKGSHPIRITDGIVDWEKIKNQDLTGCLTTVDDNNQETLLRVRAGRVENPVGDDPRQAKMF